MPRLSFSFRRKAFYQKRLACFFTFNFLTSSQTTTVPQSLGESRRDILHNGDKFLETTVAQSLGESRRDILHNGDKFLEVRCAGLLPFKKLFDGLLGRKKKSCLVILAIVTDDHTAFGTGDITHESTPLSTGNMASSASLWKSGIIVDREVCYNIFEDIQRCIV
ncbi:hypothetical protein CDAR_368941 [Caerostris darwini]|uniref:Uncharacterized protein n=1 Tax=Caerostris darwini TaxID=1538125 RepID=A0AAV4NHA7_9ARAC|nr:hypothetical protein CDAR_368941 [Caerostris darwini]